VSGNDAPHADRLRIPVLRPDAFHARGGHERCHVTGIERVDLIKIDGEGAEEKAIYGSEKVIERDRPMIICEVLAGRTGQALQPLLDAHDYHYALITEKGLIPRAYIQGDSTFANMNDLFSPRTIPEIESTFLS